MKNVKAHFYLVSLILGGLLFSGCSAPAPAPVPFQVHQAELLEATALKVMEAGNWKASEQTWAEVARKYALLDHRDRQAIALHNQAYSAFRNGKFQSALALASEAASINRQGSEWWRNQILLLQIEQKISLELQEKRINQLLPLSEAEELESKHLALWALFMNEYGAGLLSKGLPEEAGAVFSYALQKVGSVEPHLSWALKSNLAEVAEALTEYGLALTSWEELLEQAKELSQREWMATALAGQGRSLWNLGQSDEATSILRRAAWNYRWLGMEEKSSQTFSYLEDCLTNLGDEEALEALQHERNAINSKEN